MNHLHFELVFHLARPAPQPHTNTVTAGKSSSSTNLTMNNLVRSVRSTGSLGVVGVFLPEDPIVQGSLFRKKMKP
jgi:hypothetical protein